MCETAVALQGAGFTRNSAVLSSADRREALSLSVIGNGSADCSSSTIEKPHEWLRRNIGTRRRRSCERERQDAFVRRSTLRAGVGASQDARKKALATRSRQHALLELNPTLKGIPKRCGTLRFELQARDADRLGFLGAYEGSAVTARLRFGVATSDRRNTITEDSFLLLRQAGEGDSIVGRAL
jgi:hypothetical protein